MTKICNVEHSDWDVHIPSVFWAYQTTCNKLTGKTPFHMVYGNEAIMPMEYIVLACKLQPLPAWRSLISWRSVWHSSLPWRKINSFLNFISKFRRPAKKHGMIDIFGKRYFRRENWSCYTIATLRSTQGSFVSTE